MAQCSFQQNQRHYFSKKRRVVLSPCPYLSVKSIRIVKGEEKMHNLKSKLQKEFAGAIMYAG